MTHDPLSTTTPPRLRFLVAGPLSPRPTGRRERLAAGDLGERLAAAPVEASVDVGPALGAAGPLAIDVRISRFRGFAAAEVVAQTPSLAELHRLAERLAAASGRPAEGEVLGTVERLVGRGALLEALTASFAPQPAAPEQPASDDLVGELLARGQQPQRSAAASMIDALVNTSSPQSRPAGAARPAAAAAHERLSAALAAAARAALAAPEVAAAEVRWRSLRLLLEQCPRDQKLDIELLDLAAADVPAALAELADEPLERPDAVFLLDPVDDLDIAGALADAAADLHTPVVLELTPGALGCASLAELIQRADDGAALSPGWDALRARDESRWLAVAVNGVALAAEATAAGERVVAGGAAIAVAALLVSSFRDAGVLSRLGREAGLRAPATWHLAHPREGEVSLQTAAPVSAAGQVRLASLGLVALGGPRSSDILALTACPVAHASPDAGVLPAQVLAGRTVRFALWIRALLPLGADPTSAGNFVMQAAAIYLLPGTEVRPRFAAAVDGDQLRVAASFSAQLAGAPVALQFALPLRLS